MCPVDPTRTSSDTADEARPADLRTMFARYGACPADSRPSSFLAFVRAENPHVLGHHACDRSDYLGHVWRIGGLYFCRGCTTVIVATPVFAALGLLTRWPVRLSTSATAATFSTLLLVALVPLRDGPRTLLHDVRRVALGCLLGSALAYVILCDDWTLRVVVVGVYLAVLVIRRAARQASGPSIE